MGVRLPPLALDNEYDYLGVIRWAEFDPVKWSQMVTNSTEYAPIL